MNCEIAREALSARLDGEESACPPEQLEEHLADCAACHQWLEAAHVVTRRARLNPASAVRDCTEEILVAVLADQARTSEDRPQPRTRPLHGRDRVRSLMRAGLVAAAFAQFFIILPALIGHAGAGVPPHASRELGAFNLALAAGFLAAAMRPALARGMNLVVGTATASLLLLAIADSVAGATTISAETPHLITTGGWLFLFGLARNVRSEGRGPTGTRGGPASLGRRVGLGILGRIRAGVTGLPATMGVTASTDPASAASERWSTGDNGSTGEVPVRRAA